MIIQPFKTYTVICKGADEQVYRWLLNVEPSKKAWKIKNQKIEVGKMFKGYLILKVDTLTTESQNKHKVYGEEDYEYISGKEFDFAVNASNLGFATTPSHAQSYRCQICGGVVANDICTGCMFDWDS